MGGQLPGIYVEIKGDYTDLERNLKAARALVTNQATGISSALNNALSPDKVRGSINALVTQFGTLNRASQISGDTFGKIGVDLGKLREITSLTEEQLAKLQSQLLRTQTSNAQENALKKIASAAGLTREEIRDLGKQFDLSVAQIDKVAVSLHGAERQAKSFADRIKGIPAIKSYAPAVAPATAGLDKSMQGGEAAFVRSVVTIGDAAQASKAAFALTKAELGELGAKVGLTAEQMDTLKSRVAAMSGEMAQTNALRSLAQSAGLARDEIKTLGAQMGVSEAQAREVANSIHGAEAAVKSYAEQIRGIPKIPTLTSLSTGAQAGVYSGYAGQYSAMAQDLTALTQAESLAGKAADAFANDIAELGKHAKLTDEQMQSLQERMSKAAVSSSQENALKRLASQLKLTDKELEDFGRQFGLTAAQMERIVGPAKNVERAVDGIGNAGKKKMDLFSGSIAMAAGEFLLLEQEAYSVQRILNATVFGFNSTVETASIGISAAFLNNGQYVDQITGKVLTGQQAMKAAMEDADGVIQQLRASNMVTIATLDQLIEAYQEAAPVALSKGFNKDQVEQFTVAMMQAAGAVDTTGMLIGQMGEEMRSLLNGGINPKNTRIATALGITNEDVKKYQGDIQGLFNFLMSKLSAYQAFGDQLQKTWKGVASNTADIFQQMSAQATEPLFTAVRDGLYEWQQGIARVVVKTDELGNVTRTLEWNPEYQRSVEQVRETIEALIGTVRENRDIIGALFEAGGSAALQSLDGINQVLALLGNVVTTAKQGAAEIKALAGIKVDIPVPWDIPGAILNGVRKANMEWTKINDKWSGKRDDAGNLTNGTAQEVAIDRIQQRVKSLKQELSVAENSISSLVFGDRTPEQIKDDIAGAESQLKGLAERAKGTAGTAAVYQPNQSAAVSEEWTKGREKFLESLKTEREKALADYEEQKQYVKTVEEGKRLRAQLSEKLASIDSKAEKSSAAAGLKAQRSELKQLGAEIKNYADAAGEASRAANKWLSASDAALRDMQNLIDQYATVGMTEYQRITYEHDKSITEAKKALDAYSGSLETVDTELAKAVAAYQLANSQLEQLRGNLDKNTAGTNVEDLNKIDQLEDKVKGLSESINSLNAQKTALDGEKGKALSLLGDIDESARIERLKSAYSQIGPYTKEIYDQLAKEYQADAEAYFLATGDKIAASKMFTDQINELNAQVNIQTPFGGMVQGLKDVAEQAKITGEDVRNYIVNAVDQLNDALVDFLIDGTSAESVLNSLSREMLAMTTKELITGPLVGGIAGMFGVDTGSIGANSAVINNPALVTINGSGTSDLFDSLLPDASSYSSSWWDDFGSSASVESGSWWESFYSGGKTASSSLWNGFSTDGQGAFASIFSGLGDIFSSLTGGVSSAGSSLFSSIASALAFADGGVFNAPGISAYSNSIVTHPTLFPFAHGIGLMGEAGAEAVMPLTRNLKGRLVGDARGLGSSDGETKALLKELIASVKGQGNTRIINTFGDTEVANAMSGAAGERVILNAIKRNPSIIRQVAR